VVILFIRSSELKGDATGVPLFFFSGRIREVLGFDELPLPVVPSGSAIPFRTKSASSMGKSKHLN